MDGIKPNSMILENREKLFLYGVSESESFDDASAVILTELGRLVIAGKNLHLAKLSLETGEAIIEGYIISISYVEKRVKKNENLLTRLFK